MFFIDREGLEDVTQAAVFPRGRVSRSGFVEYSAYLSRMSKLEETRRTSGIVQGRRYTSLTTFGDISTLIHILSPLLSHACKQDLIVGYLAVQASQIRTSSDLKVAIIVG